MDKIVIKKQTPKNIKKITIEVEPEVFEKYSKLADKAKMNKKEFGEALLKQALEVCVIED